ncbi:hypothetical protein L0F51_00325 [Afifella sp. H1R]|uniref:hypothetical protein n=1 Tax=Afifella sp. H1R TaxID=2908841 RepID=UPI001F1CF951|nr:hypothetical protein [Afifella sp. H1R]MCF1502210.1 hypothetical protein [Afifella sp. H1R]
MGRICNWQVDPPRQRRIGRAAVASKGAFESGAIAHLNFTRGVYMVEGRVYTNPAMAVTVNWAGRELYMAQPDGIDIRGGKARLLLPPGTYDILQVDPAGGYWRNGVTVPYDKSIEPRPGTAFVQLVLVFPAGLLSQAEKDALIMPLNVQADWDVSDSESTAFIKNKPSVVTKVELEGRVIAEVADRLADYVTPTFSFQAGEEGIEIAGSWAPNDYMPFVDYDLIRGQAAKAPISWSSVDTDGGEVADVDQAYVFENRVWRALAATIEDPSEVSADWEFLYHVYVPARAWKSGVTTAEPFGQYAFDNAVWLALVETTNDPAEASGDWEFLYSGPSTTHNHDDRYYTKSQLDRVALAGIPAVSDIVPIEGVTPAGYVRATTTSRTDPAGNAQSVPAGVIPVDYDATTGALLGWLFDDADDTWSVPLEATFDVGEGAIYIRGRTGSLTGQKALWVLDDGTSDNYIYLAHSSGNFTLGIKAGGTTALNATLGAVATDTDFALAIAWVGTAVKASINGAAFTSHTAAGLPSGLTTERRGEMPAGTSGGLHWAGHAKHFARFARAVDGATLQAITGGLA